MTSCWAVRAESRTPSRRASSCPTMRRGGESGQDFEQLGVFEAELARLVGGGHRDGAEQRVLVQQRRGDLGVDARGRPCPDLPGRSDRRMVDDDRAPSPHRQPDRRLAWLGFGLVGLVRGPGRDRPQRLVLRVPARHHHPVAAEQPHRLLGDRADEPLRVTFGSEPTDHPQERLATHELALALGLDLLARGDVVEVDRESLGVRVGVQLQPASAGLERRLERGRLAAFERAGQPGVQLRVDQLREQVRSRAPSRLPCLRPNVCSATGLTNVKRHEPVEGEEAVGDPLEDLARPAPLLGDLAPLGLDLGAQPAPIEGGPDGAPQARLGDLRLVQAVERAGAEGGRGKLGGGVGAHHDDGERHGTGAVAKPGRAARDQTTSGSWKSKIAQSGGSRRQISDGRRAGIDDGRLVPQILVSTQVEHVQIRPGRVVFDDQDAYDVAAHVTVPLPTPVNAALAI